MACSPKCYWLIAAIRQDRRWRAGAALVCEPRRPDMTREFRDESGRLRPTNLRDVDRRRSRTCRGVFAQRPGFRPPSKSPLADLHAELWPENKNRNSEDRRQHCTEFQDAEQPQILSY